MLCKRVPPLAVFIAVLLIGVLSAQADVRIVRKPPPAYLGPDVEVVYDSWWVTWALRDDTEPSMGVARFNTQAEAVAYAERLIARNHASSPPGSWTRIKFVQIEGEPSWRKKDQPTLPEFQELVLEAVGESPEVLKAVKGVEFAKMASEDPKHLLTVGLAKTAEPGALGSVLGDYASNIEGAYDRAKMLKERMLGGIEKLTDDQFKQVNQAIGKFNGMLDNPPAGVDSKALAKFPRLSEVTPETIEQAKPWQEAIQLGLDLRSEKQKLDDERTRLEAEGPSLIQELESVEAEEATVRSLRERAESVGGPFRVEYMGVPDASTTFGEFPTLEAARKAIPAARRQDFGYRYGGSPLAEPWILDGKGTRVGPGYVPPTPDPVLTKAADEAESRLRQRRAELNARIRKYQQDKTAYQAALEAYKQKNAAKKTMAERLKEFAYQRAELQDRGQAQVATKPRVQTSPQTPRLQTSTPTPRSPRRPGLFRRR